MSDEWEYDAHCPCGFKVQANSLAHARELLEAHEKEKHKGKPVGSFGQQKKWKLPSYSAWEKHYTSLKEKGLDCLLAWKATNHHFGMAGGYVSS